MGIGPGEVVRLGRERQHRMNQQRLNVLAERVAQDYQTILPMPEPVASVFRQLLAVQQAGFMQSAQQERWLRLSLSKGEGSTTS